MLTRNGGETRGEKHIPTQETRVKIGIPIGGDFSSFAGLLLILIWSGLLLRGYRRGSFARIGHDLAHELLQAALC
jgi:hypothetical protein